MVGIKYFYDSIIAKLNNTTGTDSIAINNNSGEDVVVFFNNQNVELKGNLNVGGVLSRYQPTPTTTAVALDVMTKILTGIITNYYTSPLTITLPTGAIVYSNLPTIDRSVDWSVISLGAATGTVTFTATGVNGHTVVGNMLVPIGTSGLFRTKASDVNVAITYRMS